MLVGDEDRYHHFGKEGAICEWNDGQFGWVYVSGENKALTEDLDIAVIFRSLLVIAHAK